MRKVLLVDLGFWKGHHETYFIKILSILVSNGYFVYASCVENEKLIKYIKNNNIKNCHVINIEPSVIDKLIRKIFILIDKIISYLSVTPYVSFSSLSNLVAIKRLINLIGEEILVFSAHADSMIPAVPIFIARLFMPQKWIGLYIQPSYRAKVALGKVKSRRMFYAEKCFSLPSCKTVLVLHPVYQRFFSLCCQNVNCLYIPELVSTNHKNVSSIVNEIKKKASDRKIVSILGVSSKRRNLILFLESLAKMDANIFLGVAVGYLNASQYTKTELMRIECLRKELSDQHYIRLDYYVPSEEEFNSLIQLSDILFINYHNHPFSSNMLTKAMAFRKSVIVRKGFLMEQIVKTYNWESITNSKTEEIVKTIQWLATNFKVDEEKYVDFVKTHSPIKFEQAILKACDIQKP